MANGAGATVDPRALERYQRDFYENTDVVYRFGVILTGSRDGAERLTEETFRSLIEDFGQYSNAKSPVEQLLTLAWQAWNKIRSEKFHEWVHPVVKALKHLDPDQKAAVYLVDIVGLEPKDAGLIVHSSEKEIRNSLAFARNQMVTGEISL